MQSIDGPDAGGGDFYEMPVRIPEVDALTTQLPRALLFHCDPVLFQPCFPIGQFQSRNRERNMKLAVAIVRRWGQARTTFLKQQQHLAIAGLHGAAALSEIADNRKPKNPLVKSR